MKKLLIYFSKSLFLIVIILNSMFNLLTSQDIDDEKSVTLITTFPFEEGFEGTTFPPAGWNLIDADGDGYNWYRITSTSYPTNSGIGAVMGETFIPGVPFIELTPDNYMITPALSLPTDVAYLHWYVRTLINWAAGETYSIMVSTTTPTVSAFTAIFTETLTAVNTTWSERFLSLEDFAGQTIYIAFRHHTTEAQYSIFIDDISVTIPELYDLEALVLSGQQNPTLGVETVYTIQIKNVGSLPADGYFVRLMSGQNVLSSVGGVELAPNEIANISVTFTPAQTGIMTIYGDIHWEADTNISNNQTETMTIDVMPAGFAQIYIGDPNSTIYDSPFPFSFGLENGVSQIIYLENEINTSGFITHLTYTFNGMGNITQQMPVRIYMGTTSMNTFPDNESWIPYNELTLVYNGLLPVDIAGVVDILIPLDEPFLYEGGNLVIMNHRIYTTYWKSGNRWLLSTTGNQNRSLHFNSTSYIVNPPQGLPAGTRQTRIANISLMLSTGGIGSLSGVVKNDTGIDLEGVLVSIEDTIFQDITNHLGQYSISYITSGTYTVYARKQGYLDIIIPNVVILANEDNILNIVMHPTPLISVSGTVRGTDTMAGLESALVLLTGNEEYQTQTNSSGNFTISGVYINNDYTLTITKQGYNRYTQVLSISNENDIFLEPIYLDERLNPPSDVIASDFTTDINLTWREPMVGNEWFSHAQNVINTGVGTNSPATFTMVQRFTQEQLQIFGVSGASLTTVSFVPMRDASYSIRIFTGGSDNPLNPGVLVHEQPISSESLTWEAWNDIVLSSEISIPTAGELWIGVHIITPTGHPAGVDFGPQVHGYGNLLFYQGLWLYMQALNTINPLPFNWLIKGYAEGINPMTSQPFLMNLNNTYFRNADLEKVTISDDARYLQGYNIWRANVNDLNDESAWTIIAENITNTHFDDPTWQPLTSGEFRYAIKAVYSNNNQSFPVFSNIVSPNKTSRVSITLLTDNEEIAENAIVRLVNNNENPDHVYQTTPIGNVAYFPSVWRGDYSLSITHNTYLPYTNSNLIIDTNPFEYEAIFMAINIVLSESFEDNFFPPKDWIIIDNDGDGWNWIHVDDLPTVFGQKLTLSQSAYHVGGGYWLPLEPDNYLITPQVSLMHEAIVNLRFWVRSDPSFPEETYSVMISETTPNPEQFVSIHTETFSNETSQWSVRNIDLSSYAGKKIYVAWRHFDSFDMNFIGLDGVVIHSSGGFDIEKDFPPPTDLSYSIEDGKDVFLSWKAPVLGVRDLRNERSIASSIPFSPPQKGRLNEVSSISEIRTPNPLTGYYVYLDEVPISDLIISTNFTNFDVPEGVYLYSVVAVYADGLSEAASIEVIMVSAEYEEIDDLYITALRGNFPNPFNQSTTIVFDLSIESNVQIDIYNVRGQRVRNITNESFKAGSYRVFWDGKDENGRVVSSGVYFYQMQSENFVYTRSMVLLK
ncbi:MAG: choice-of-anchor J domain-containing protein [Candidatus Cloacimonetes bacterium]|nr:choice-of-anchor J domain-containing protein [Candidatus Cloacimonadota bacterium]